MLTGSAYLNLVRDNQRIRADNLRMRQEEIERAPAPEYTPQRQVPAARNRLRWGDEEKENFVSELASMELNLTEVNSAVLMHLSQPGSHSLLDLSKCTKHLPEAQVPLPKRTKICRNLNPPCRKHLPEVKKCQCLSM